MKKYTMFFLFLAFVFGLYSVIGVGYASAKLLRIASITVISPNGGEVLVQGKTQKISWTIKNPEQESLTNIGVYLVDSSGTHKISLINKDVSYGQRSVMYTPETNVPVGQYRVMVSAYNLDSTKTVWDVSDAPFSVIAQ